MQPTDPADAVVVTDERSAEGRLLAVRVAGDLDRCGASIAEAPLSRFIEDVGTELVIDMTELGFVDVGGLNLLVRVTQKLAPRDTAIRLRNPPDLLVRMIDLADLHDRFTIEYGGEPLPPHRRLHDR